MKNTTTSFIEKKLKQISDRKITIYNHLLWSYYLIYGLEINSDKHKILQWNFNAEIANDPIIDMLYRQINEALPKPLWFELDR